MNKTYYNSIILYRKKIFLFSFIILLLLLCGCKKSSVKTSEYKFTAQVVSLSDDTLLVRPEDNTKEDQICSQIYVPLDTTIVDSNGNDMDIADLAKASRVEITYDGVMDNSDPALISNCFQILILE